VYLYVRILVGLNVFQNLKDKVDGAGCSSPDEDWLLRRRSTINTLHIVDSCRRGVGIEFDIRRLDTPWYHTFEILTRYRTATGSDLNQSRHQIDEHEICLVGAKASRDAILIPKWSVLCFAKSHWYEQFTKIPKTRFKLLSSRGIFQTFEDVKTDQ